VVRDWILDLTCTVQEIEELDRFPSLQKLSIVWVKHMSDVLDDYIPKSLTELTLGDDTFCQIDTLPPNLKKLHFGNNAVVYHIAPGLLTTLEDVKFGDFFSGHKQFLENELPSLVTLEFGADFFGDLSRLQCPNLKSLKLCSRFSGVIPDHFKDKLEFVLQKPIQFTPHDLD
jgi:hypothetical protein